VAGEDNTDVQVDSAGPVDPAGTAVAHVRVVHMGAAAHAIPVTGLVLGRRVDDGLTIDDDRMSRRHARIARVADGWQVSDTGSRNGGHVDGRPLWPGQSAPLADGAVIRLGNTVLVFRTGELPPAETSDDFPGGSPVASAVRLRLQRLAASAGHVLIVGETGTGKERAAHAIGRGGPDAPFVPQNCAELNHDLARGELFGHTRGAFTGATAPRRGLVELADGGALFLDEIGELSLDVQAELLRFLEDGSYRVLGAPALHRSSARVVAATNVDLDEAVRRGRFRRDLLARLRAAHAPLELPPLRARRDDILDWAARFLVEVAPGVAAPWTAGAAECLLLYPWPENLRELRSVVRTVGAHRTQWPVDAAELPARLRDHRAGLRGAGGERVTPPQPAAPVGGPALPSRADIEHALRTTGGRMRTAAMELGVDRRRLYRLCESHGIEVEVFRRHNGPEDDDHGGENV
jgi:DNA-binding NtrC family response regulator